MPLGDIQREASYETKDLKALKKKRGVIKGKLTLYKKYIHTLEPGQISTDRLIDLELRTDRLKLLFGDFEQTQDEIETICDDYEIQLQERESFESDYYVTLAKATSYIAQGRPSEPPSPRHFQNKVDSTSECIKYPDISLPNFEGDIKQWIEFRDTFDAIVNQSNLKPIQKYKYLRASLKGSALEVIMSLEYGEDSYDLAWKLLCERYNNPRIIINNHLKALFKSEIVQATPEALRSLIDSISKHLRTIKSLNVDIENWDLLIIFFLSSRLEPSLQQKWEEKVSSKELPTLQDFKAFLRARADLLETLNSNTAQPTTEIRTNAGRKTFMTTTQPIMKGKPVFRCPHCSESHFINQCPKFLRLSIEARTRVIKQCKLCLNCFGSNHMIQTCRASKCRSCGGKHHTLLHDPARTRRVGTETTHDTRITNTQETMHTLSNSSNIPNSNNSLETYQSPRANQVVNTTFVQPNNEQFTYKSVILSTALVNIRGSDNELYTFRALLDSGSQSNFLTKRAYEILQLQKHTVNVEVRGFNDSSTKINYFCNLSVLSRDNSYSTENIVCFIVPKLCRIPQLRNSKMLQIPDHYQLADEYFFKANEIDMILGAEQFYNILCIGQHRLGPDLPILQRTRFGWVVSGPVPADQGIHSVRCNFTINNKYNETTNCMWQEGRSDPMSLPNDEITKCEEIFSTHSRAADGKFIVTIPFKVNPSVLGKSRHIAYKRLKILEVKFSRNPEFEERYIKFMRDFEETGNMIKLQAPSIEKCNYLPHHAVVNHDNPTTPLRVVYDASCQTDSGVSLNDIQFKGNINQDELFNIILRFRTYAFVVCADIEKMYRMINIHTEQRNLQCILWRENPQQPISTYALTTLSFGLRSAPHLATRCLSQLATECRDRCPDAALAIETSFYIDDLIFGNESESNLARIVIQIKRILLSAKFKLRKWKSNSQTVLDAVSMDDTSSSVGRQMPISLGDKSNKVLGLAWCQITDNLTFTLQNERIESNLTKRKVLSILSSIFDPLGLLTPVLIRGKLFIQRLFTEKTGWDEFLPIPLREEWNSIYKNIFSLKSLSVPRHTMQTNATELEIHGFADSSLTAYGAALYIRSINKSGQIQVRLLCSKSRIARNETIPRLELRAATLLATLYNKVYNAIKIKINKTYLWSDSTIVLAWIKNEPKKLQCFAANRVKEIHKLTDVTSWHWVKSKHNPADLITHGITAPELVRCALWWQGPAWLGRPSDEWPADEPAPPPPPVYTPEQLISSFTTSDTTHENEFTKSLFARYSCAIKLSRVVAYMFRFLQYTKRIQFCNGPLTVTEINNALYRLIQLSQLESFPNEYNLLIKDKQLPKNSKLLQLKPFIQNGLIRVGGRLANSYYEHDKKHPIILHNKHILTQLIVVSEHKRLLHAGPQLLLASIRERFWPIQGKSLVNKVVHNCIRCFKVNPKPTIPIMGDLPQARVTPSPPFWTTGIDYAGPFIVRDRRGRGYKCYKCYVCIFVCFSTKAIHIELVSSLESQAFISTLRRFICRRGKPRVLVSDNATTFIGANNELKELFQFFETYSKDIMTYSANEGITWNFLPVYTPHMGGLHEAAVKSCKYHLKRVVGQALLTYEEFVTYLVQVEGILNSRPLCPIPSSDSDDVPVLTPAHFLIGRSLTSLPDYDYQDVPVTKLKHHQQIQQMQQDFWSRWSRDYVGLLQQRTKWRAAKGPRLNIGSVVLIKDNKMPPCCWRLGRITNCHDGPDDTTRVATIQTQAGTIKRAFNNICVLPINGID